MARDPPSPTGLTQIANLDNNTGPSTRELASEASATNLASVQGTYEAPSHPDSDGGPGHGIAHGQHRGVRMRKSVDPTTFTAGGVATYTLTVDTSEYASADFTITDVIPAGVCPLGGPGTDYATGSPPDCAGGPGPLRRCPTPRYPEPDGTFTVASTAVVAANGTATITYSGAMLHAYPGGPLRVSPPPPATPSPTTPR